MLAVVNKRQSRATYGDGQEPSRGCSNYRWRTPARQIANLAMTKIVGFFAVVLPTAERMAKLHLEIGARLRQQTHFAKRHRAAQRKGTEREKT